MFPKRLPGSGSRSGREVTKRPARPPQQSRMREREDRAGVQCSAANHASEASWPEAQTMGKAQERKRNLSRRACGLRAYRVAAQMLCFLAHARMRNPKSSSQQRGKASSVSRRPRQAVPIPGARALLGWLALSPFSHFSSHQREESEPSSLAGVRRHTT